MTDNVIEAIAQRLYYDDNTHGDPEWDRWENASDNLQESYREAAAPYARAVRAAVAEELHEHADRIETRRDVSFMDGFGVAILSVREGGRLDD